MDIARRATSLTPEEIVALLVEHDRLDAALRAKSSKIEELEARIRWFERQLFGRKSERRLLSSDAPSSQLPLGLYQEEQTPPSPTETVRSYERRTGSADSTKDESEEESASRLRFSDDVPVETIEVPNPEAEGVPSECISEKVTHRLAQRPGSYVVLRYVRKVVKLPDGRLSEPPAPPSVLERSVADVSFLAGVLIDKFVYHLPLYRQHQRLSAQGVTLSRQTLTNLVHRGVLLLSPIYYAQLSSVLQSKLLSMDETPIKAGRVKPGSFRTAYFWPLYGEKDEVAFPYSPTRAHDTVKRILGEWAGTLLSDGYDAYGKYAATIEGVILAQCWAHTRRHFFDARDSDPPRVERALSLIGKLYENEDAIRTSKLSGEKKLEYRVEKSRPVVDEFFSFLSSCFADLTLLPSHPFAKAASYAMKRRAELSVFLQDPEVPIDTNHLERALRPIPMGRKAWLFCWTEVGAEVVGIIQSLLVTCRLHGIDPYTYLVDVLQRIDTHPAVDVHLLTPRLWKEHFADNPMRAPLDLRKNGVG